jgi:hypothetical protein
MATKSTSASSSAANTSASSLSSSAASPTGRQERKEREEKIAVPKKKATPVWLSKIYNGGLFTPEELLDIYEIIRYLGFNRDAVLAELEERCPEPKVAVELIIGCALRGPQAMSRIKMSNGKTPTDMKIPASGMKGSEGLSCQRITAATADLAAFYLKKLDVPKRLPSLACPGWLQFPSAGSIKLPEPYRTQHIEFATKFSQLIGGAFNEQIYGQMVQNSYLSEDLHLFD